MSPGIEKSRLEKRVLKGDTCAGCGLCASIVGPENAEMALVGEGYYRPQFKRPLTKEEDDLILSSCPGNKLDLLADPNVVDPTWGPVEEACLAYATDDEIRFNASSGGGISAVINHMLETGQADYVLHTCADKEAAILNETITSTTRADVISAAGSRYGPSSPLENVVQHLAKPERFIFVGKPCDVAALRMYSRTDAMVDQKVPAMLSFMCAGVPSVNGTRELLNRMGTEEARVDTFRYRGQGWPGYATAKNSDGTENKMDYDSAWGGILTHHRQLRCKICPDGTGYFADISFGDGWYLENNKPVFDERPGRSAVLVRTHKGSKLLNDCIEAGVLKKEPLTLQEVEYMQPSQASRTRLTVARQLAMRLMGRFSPQFRGLKLGEAAKQTSLKANLKSFLGAIKRIISGRL